MAYRSEKGWQVLGGQILHLPAAPSATRRAEGIVRIVLEEPREENSPEVALRDLLPEKEDGQQSHRSTLLLMRMNDGLEYLTHLGLRYQKESSSSEDDKFAETLELNVDPLFQMQRGILTRTPATSIEGLSQTIRRELQLAVSCGVAPISSVEDFVIKWATRTVKADVLMTLSGLRLEIAQSEAKKEGDTFQALAGVGSYIYRLIEVTSTLDNLPPGFGEFLDLQARTLDNLHNLATLGALKKLQDDAVKSQQSQRDADRREADRDRGISILVALLVIPSLITSFLGMNTLGESPPAILGVDNSWPTTFAFLVCALGIILLLFRIFKADHHEG